MTTNFAPNSRYATTETTTIEVDGKEIVHLKRRFVPSPDRFAVLQEHVVTRGERLDVIAHTHIGDPELFWRLCDANGAMRPDELTETVGRRLKITLPEGIPDAPHE
jgi:hypothetical protein